MAKNLIPEIAKMLGVELGEEFEIKGRKGVAYKFIIDELIVSGSNNAEHGYTSANMVLASLVRGDAEIVKLPWKPKKEERCWYIITDPDCDNEESLIAVEGWWYGSFDEQVALKAGVVFRTREEAQKALPKVAAEMGVDYEL